MLHQGMLAVDPIPHGNDGKIRPIGFAGIRVMGFGAGTAVTAPQIVQADHKKTIGIDGFAGANAGIPPAWLFVVTAVEAGGMVVAGKGVADQDSITLGRVQLAIGFKHQLIVGQGFATLQGDGVVAAENLGLDDANGAFLLGGIVR